MHTNNPDQIWKSIKGELEVVVNPALFKAHIPGAYIKKIDEENKIIEITALSDYQRNLIEDRMYGHLKEITAKVVSPEYKLMFSVTKKSPAKLNVQELGPLFDQQTKKQSTMNDTANKARASGLNEQYKIQRFVVGNCNRLAYAVSTAIANNPGKVYNPFFLYSGVGLGKTHLVQAIGHQILEKHPNMTILYKTGEQWLNEVIDAVRRGGGGTRAKRSAFKKKYRNVDVLIIDDVHSIAGKDKTQEEFFHTFNALYMSQKQIILTSDRAPHEIRTLEERLSSRFASGMISDIQPPDWETRLAILRNRNEEMNLNAPKEVLEYIATSVNTNIRDLEARLLQTITRARTEGMEINKNTVELIIGQIDKEKGKRVTPGTIIKEVAKYYGITIKDIKGKRRLKTIVMPRQVCMFLLRDMIEMGFQSIGELLGNRDHSTVMHGTEKVEHLITRNASFLREVNQIKGNISTSS